MVAHSRVGERTASPVGQHRGFPILLRLLLLLLVQQTFPLAGRGVDPTAMLKASTAVVGFLLAPQDAGAQDLTITLGPGSEQVTLNYRTNQPPSSIREWGYQVGTSSRNYQSNVAIPDSGGKSSGSHVVSGLTSGDTYYFRIWRTSTDGTSAFRNEVSVTLPTVALTVNGNDGWFGFEWVYDGPTDGAVSWQLEWIRLSDRNGEGRWLDLPGGGALRAYSYSATNGETGIFRVRLVGPGGRTTIASSTVNNQGWIEATPRADTPTLVSTASRTLTVTPGGTVNACFNLLSVTAGDTTYLESRPGQTAVAAHAALSHGTHGVRISSNIAGVQTGVGQNLYPCARLGVGTHTVHWHWKGHDGTAASEASTSTTYTIVQSSTVPAPTLGSDGTSILMDWTDPEDASIIRWEFQLKAGDGSYGSWTAVPSSSATTTSHHQFNVQVSTEYHVRIRAVKPGNSYLVSAEASIITPPNIPTGVTATPGAGSVRLSWTDPENDKIIRWEYRQLTGAAVTDGFDPDDFSDWTPIPSSSATTTSHTISGLTAGTTYSFQIRAVHSVDSKEKASRENIALEATPTAASTKTITLSVASASITEGDSGSSTDVTVTVTLGEAAPAADPDLGIFSVSLISDSPLGTAQGSNKGSNPCAAPLNPVDTDWCLPDGSTISIAEGQTQGTKKVRILGDTRDESNETIKLVSSAAIPGWTSGRITLTITDDDDPATTTVPAAPTGLSATAGNGQVVLSWTKPAGSITSYKLKYSKTGVRSSATYAAMTGSSGTTTAHTVTGLDNDAEYSFKIRAVNAGGDGTETEWVTATPTAPTTPVVTAPSSAGVTISRAALSLMEGGSAGTYTVVLDTDPGATVTVTPASSDTDAVSVSAPLVFNSTNWETEKTVTVTPQDDVDTNNENITVSHAISSGYSGVSSSDIADVTVTVNDDDVPAGKSINLSTTTATIDEGDSGKTNVAITVTLGESSISNLPVRLDIIDASSTATKNTNVSTTSCSSPQPATADFCHVGPFSDNTGISIDRALTVGTFTLGILGDTDYEPDETITLRVSINPLFYPGWRAKTMTLTITNDDDPPLAATQPPAKPTGLTATVLSRQATLTWTNPEDASITKWQYQQKVGGAAWGSWTDFPNSQASTKDHTFTELTDGTQYQFRVRAVNDAGNSAESEVVTATPELINPVLTVSATQNGQADLSWTVSDNTPARLITGAVELLQWNWRYRLRGAGSNSWKVVTPASASGSNLVAVRSYTHNYSRIPIVPHGAVVEYQVGVVGRNVRGQLVFGPWSDTATATVIHTAEPALTLTPSTVNVATGATATYTVALKQANAGTLRITSDTTGKATVNPASLDFTTSNYSTGQTVMVTGVAVGTATINHAFRLTGASADAIPDAGTVAVTVTRATSGVTIRPTSLTVNEGSRGDYTVVLNTAPSASVTVTVAGASGDVTVAGSPVIFSPSNWDTAKTVTVKAGTDEDTDDDSATLTHAASGSATGYDSSLEIDDVRVSVTDITPTLQLLTNPAAVREGENISLTVTSDKDVTGDLPVNLTLEDPGSSGFTAADIDGTLGPRNFTASFGVSASKTGRVSIATSRDGVVESAENYRITLNDGPGYKPGADKQADGTLNDGTTSLSIADVSQAEDGTFSFTVTASPPPSAPVTFKYKVTAESGDTAIAGTDFTEVSTATAKTIAANASGTTITVSVTDDDLDESDETFTVTLSEPSAGAVLGDATATGTITDNDESPELDAIADQTIKLGQAVAITALATDGDGDTVTYAWTRKSGETTPALPVGTARNQAQLTFPTTAVGTYSMTVTANDGNGNTDTEEVVITVTNEDIVSVPGNLVVAESVGNATVRITTTTAFGKALTFNITYGGSEAMGDGTPANGDYDNDAVTTVDFSSTDTSKDIAIPVTDDDLDENDETFTVSIALAPGNTLPDDFTLGNTTTTVSITDDDESPVLTEITDQTISQGEVVDITASATDGDGDTLTYIWTRKAGESTPSLPVGTVLNQARLRFTPPATATGTYTMAVTASDGNGNRDTEEVVITVSAPVATVPGKPTGLTATRSGDGEVRLSWTKPTGPITSYEVRYGKTDNRDSATWTAIASSDATTVSHRVENLDSGSEYSFQVRAINDAGDGIATDWVTATLQSSTAGVTVSPTTLSLREGGTTGSYTVVLNTDPSATVTVTPTSRDSIAVTVSAALSFTPSNWDTAQTVTVTPLQDEDATDENITVSHDISGYSGVSNVDGVTVTVTDTTPTLQLLDDPTGVSEGTAISLTVTSDKARTGDLPVMLTLAARSASGFDADDIEGPLGPRSFSASFGESASTSGTVSIPTSADAVVEGGEAYRITLSDGSGYAVGDDTTADGTINDATPPAQPAGFTATAGDGMVTLGWQDPDNDSITVYQLRQKRGSAAWGGWGEISGSGATTTRHIVTNLDNEVEYSFRIRARNSGGESDESAVATATPTDAISTGPVLQLLNNPAAVREGEAIRLTVTADREQTGRLPLSLTLSARSSSFNANDISGALGPRTFNADFGGSGRTTGTVTISTRRDSLVEGAEAYRITLNPAAGYTVGDASTADGRLNDGTIPSVTVFPTALTVVEGGSTTYTVRLNNQPSADVTITVGGASGDVSVTDSSLIFTPANYRRAQTVTVNAASDEDTTNDRATLTHSANGGGYNSARINNVRVSVTDTTERTPVFQLRTDPAPVREGEAIRLIITASRTVIGNRSVSLTLSPRSGSSFDADDIEGTLGPGNFTASFAASPGSTSGTVIIPSRSDALVEGDEAYRITLNSGSGYELGTDTTADGTINDGTIPGVTVSPTALTMAEGGSGTYTVRLDNQPSGNVTITVGGASGDVTVAGSPLIFTSANYSRAQTVTVNAAADEDTANDRATLTHSANGGGYHSVSIDSVSVTVTDTTPVFQLRNDPAPVREGEAIRLTITANRTVVGNRSVSLTLSPRSGSSFDANDIEGMPGPGNFTVSFAASPGSTSGTVIIPTRNDTVVEGAEHYRITLNDGSGYALGTDTTADGTINDGTTGSVTVSPTALTVAEGGSTTYTVRLDNQPSAEVTITVGGASGDVTVADSSLTFTPANYSRVQTVTVNAAADEDATDDSATLIHSASGGGYNSVSIDPVIVTVDDDDTAGVTVSPTTLPMHEGRSGQYTVKLDTEPSGTVTITPTTGDSRAVMVSAALTFTTANWKTPQTVMVSTSQDADAKDETVTVRHAVTGYGAVTTAAPVTVEVTDDETEHLGQPEARKEELVGLSRATLGMATDMIGARIAGDLPGNGAGAGSIGDQAWAMMGNLLGFSHGSELSTNLSLEQLEEQLWRQSFHISQTDRETDQQGWHAAGEQQGSWSLWGAGELRSFKGDDASDAENHSYSGSIKAGWLGIDYQFTNAWLAGLAVSFSSSESHYTYRSEGGMGAGETETQLTTFLPYGSLQLTERLQLWGTAGIGFGDLRHQSNDDDDDSEAQGALKVHLAAIGFEQKLSSLSSWNAFSLAGDLAVVQSSTEWQDNALNDQSVSITRARLGVNSSFPLSQTTTGYMTLRGRLDGGDLQMGAAEMLLGLRYSTGRFSALLQGRQTSALDGSYSESGILGQLRFSSQQDGTGLAFQLQPSFGPYGEVGSEQASLWNDQQLDALTGWNGNGQQGAAMALKSTIGYGFLLPDSNLLLTPFAEAAFTQATSHQIGLGISMEGPSWQVKLSGSREESSNSAPTGTLKLMFSKQL